MHTSTKEKWNVILWKSTSDIFSPCRQLRAISSIRKPRSSRAVAASCQRCLRADLELRAFEWKSSRKWQPLAWEVFSSAGLPLKKAAKSSPAFPLQVPSSSQSKGSLFCQAPSAGEGARETQAQLATAQGSWGRGTCPVSPDTKFSYFGSWSPSPIKHVPSYSLPVPTSLGDNERTGKFSHHMGEKFLWRT